MSDFLKGNYKVNAVINDDQSEKKDEFREKVLSSVGGSMVFVERKKMIWNGDEDEIDVDK